MRGSLARLAVALGGLCVGVVYGLTTSTTSVPVAIGVSAACVLLGRRSGAAAIAAVAGLAFGFGAIDARVRLAQGSAMAALAQSVPRCDFSAVVLETEGGLGTLVAPTRLACAGRASTDVGRGLVFIADPAPAGALLGGEGWLVPLSSDDFGRARRRFGAGAELVVDDVVVRPPDGGLQALAKRVRAGLDAATRGLPVEEGALLQGVTTGETDGLGEDVQTDFRRAGLSHVVAVSGENVAMVLGALALVTRRASRRARAALASAVLGLFVLVVGPQPSVLRAAGMALVVIVAFLRGARVEPWHCLCAALIGVIALRPAIVFSAGLQLSVAATAGILLWARPWSSRVSFLPRWASVGLAVALAAQIATAPLIAWLFGQISTTGPIANLLALPAVPPATVLGLCAALAGTMDPRLGAPFARAAQPFVAWVLLVARWLGRPPWAALAVPSWGPLGLALGCAALAIVAARVSRANVRVGSMPSYSWIVHAADGRDLSRTPSFGSREEAEEWLGSEWAALAESGGDAVSLVADDDVVYRMSLQPE